MKVKKRAWEKDPNPSQESSLNAIPTSPRKVTRINVAQKELGLPVDHLKLKPKASGIWVNLSIASKQFTCQDVSSHREEILTDNSITNSLQYRSLPGEINTIQTTKQSKN